MGFNQRKWHFTRRNTDFSWIWIEHFQVIRTLFFFWFDQPFVMGDFSNENWWWDDRDLSWEFIGISSIDAWDFSSKKTATTGMGFECSKYLVCLIFFSMFVEWFSDSGFALKRWLQALLILKCIARQSACERVLRNIAYRMRPGTTVEEEWEETRTLSQESTSQVIPWIQIWFLHRTSANFSSHVFGLTTPSTFYSTCADV